MRTIYEEVQFSTQIIVISHLKDKCAEILTNFKVKVAKQPTYSTLHTKDEM